MSSRHRFTQLRAFARDVAGDSAKALVATLVDHLDVVLEGVALARRLVEDEASATEVEPAIEQVEHRGDRLRQQLVAELSQTLVTPLDREDLFRLSRAIDDVLDNLRDFIREWSLYAPRDGHPFTSLLETIGRGVESLRAAVGAISLRAGEPTPYLLAAKRDANRARRRFEEEVAALLTEEVTPEVLKRRELLRRLDIVGLRLGEATDTFSDALVKRGSGLSIFTKSTPRDAATEGK